MRTITISLDEHGLVRFSFDHETSRAMGFAAFTMTREAASAMAEDVEDSDYGYAHPFVGIVHDGGEVQLNITSKEQ